MKPTLGEFKALENEVKRLTGLLKAHKINPSATLECDPLPSTVVSEDVSTSIDKTAKSSRVCKVQ